MLVDILVCSSFRPWGRWRFPMYICMYVYQLSVLFQLQNHIHPTKFTYSYSHPVNTAPTEDSQHYVLKSSFTKRYLTIIWKDITITKRNNTFPSRFSSKYFPISHGNEEIESLHPLIFLLLNFITISFGHIEQPFNAYVYRGRGTSWFEWQFNRWILV